MLKYSNIIISIFVSMGIMLSYIAYNRILYPFYNNLTAELPIKGTSSFVTNYHKYMPRDKLLKQIPKTALIKKITPNSSEFWFLYLYLLIDNNRHFEANFLLKRILSSKIITPDFFRYLRICDFADKNGIKNANIEKSAKIYRKLNESYQNKTLYNLLKGKKVAVVGNSPYEIGKKSGKEIDSHDIVIRMNNYVIEGFEEDYGTKEDIWIFGFGGPNIKDRTLEKDYLYVGMTGDYTYLPLLFNFHLERLYRDMFERKINIGTVDPVIYRNLRYKYDIEPSSGFYIIYTLIKWGIDFDVYGFSFLEPGNYINDFSVDYFKDNTGIIPPQPHSVNAEVVLLSNWFDYRHVKKNINLEGTNNE